MKLGPEVKNGFFSGQRRSRANLPLSKLNTSEPFKGSLARQRSSEKILPVKKKLKIDFCHLKKNWNNILKFFKKCCQIVNFFLNFIFFEIRILGMLNL